MVECSRSLITCHFPTLRPTAFDSFGPCRSTSCAGCGAYLSLLLLLCMIITNFLTTIHDVCQLYLGALETG
ncbi:hypothetical protein BV22DRAFT_305664 [Leucogyrophana mollusca]|uniref:Uncharacterized protein n=1 Tax=Leucogyrophana mollusca TaxID=85980 RepID=A0ACB8BMV6_9AGAM|nr:hypothetical protein BV22DRAFT_305664 [Leucogyrophana mollusca]